MEIFLETIQMTPKQPKQHLMNTIINQLYVCHHVIVLFPNTWHLCIIHRLLSCTSRLHRAAHQTNLNLLRYSSLARTL